MTQTRRSPGRPDMVLRRCNDQESLTAFGLSFRCRYGGSDRPGIPLFANIPLMPRSRPVRRPILLSHPVSARFGEVVVSTFQSIRVLSQQCLDVWSMH